MIGGPHGDAGLTGRKIIVDSLWWIWKTWWWGFLSKDPSKVDRSACYMCRYIAKNLVAAGLSDRCEVQLAYAIELQNQLLYVNTFGTNKILKIRLEDLVRKNFDMKPSGIISQLNLREPIYRKTASYGHFGRNEPEFTWEKTNKSETLKQSAGL